jgi:competence protein ComQ
MPRLFRRKQMNKELMHELYRMVDDYFTEPDLNAALKLFMKDKLEEGLRWSDITRYSHYMLGGASPLIDRCAALSEMMILAIDIVDDIQDRDNPSKPWMQFPADQTLNAVCSLLVAFIAEVPGELAPVAGRLLAHSVNGQQKDLNGSVQTETDYMEMIHKKSGSLLRFACHMGVALIPGLEPDIRQRMDELAECVGVIAQLENDLTDLSKLDLKSDLMCKKRTLPILFLLRDGETEFPPIYQYYEGMIEAEQFFEHKNELLAYVVASGCIEYTRVIQSLYMERAEELLQSLPGTESWKEQFRSITFGVKTANAAAAAAIET